MPVLKDPLRKMKQEVLQLSAYDLKPHPYQIKLNQNENPFDVPQFLKDELARAVLERPWGRYPDFQPTHLTEKLAAQTGWVPRGIAVGNGSNELLQNILLLALERGRKLLLVPPTFSLYRILGLSHAATLIEVPFEDFAEFPRARLLDTIAEQKPDVMVLCSPNNPTGTLLDTDLLREILELSDGIVVLDQAYHEFSDAGGRALELLKVHPHLVITRTFSKALAAAGLRLGYMLAHPEVITQVKKVKLPYNINFITLAAAELLLDNLHAFLGPIQELIQERHRLFEAMSDIPGVEAFPSQANFILFRVPGAGAIFDRIRKQGILIRDLSSAPGLENCLRVSVGMPTENEAFLRALQESLS